MSASGDNNCELCRDGSKVLYRIEQLEGWRKKVEDAREEKLKERDKERRSTFIQTLMIIVALILGTLWNTYTSKKEYKNAESVIEYLRQIKSQEPDSHSGSSRGYQRDSPNNPVRPHGNN